MTPRTRPLDAPPVAHGRMQGPMRTRGVKLVDSVVDRLGTPLKVRPRQLLSKLLRPARPPAAVAMMKSTSNGDDGRDVRSVTWYATKIDAMVGQGHPTAVMSVDRPGAILQIWSRHLAAIAGGRRSPAFNGLSFLSTTNPTTNQHITSNF